MSEPVEGWPSPPYRITTPRLVLRPYAPGDVDAVHAAILAHREVLRPWMPWVGEEPRTRDARAEVLRRMRGQMDLGLEFVYGVFEPDGAYVGGAGLHPRQGPETLEIGYWIVEDRWGRGLATEAAAALTRVGFERMGAVRMEIRVAPGNGASLRVAEKLGYRREGRLRAVARSADEEPVDLVVFGMLEDEVLDSPAQRVPIELEGFA